MTVFYVNLGVTFILALMSKLHPKGKIDKKPLLFFTILIITVLTLVSGLRNGIGDTGDYKHLYELVATGQEIGDGFEAGFILLINILVCINTDPQFFIFMLALITNVLNIWIFRSYSSLFELEIYMYITSGYYLVTMNGIRQALAAAIMFGGTKYIINGNFIKFSIVTILASTIHTSAIILIPVYFIVRNEAWSKKIMIIILLSSIGFLFFQPIMQVFFKAAEGSRYAGYEDAIMNGGEGGASILRTIIAAVPVVIAYIGRDKLKEEWPESNVFVNMSLINLIIMTFSLYNWIFARFNFYFQTYSFILLPFCISKLFNKKQKPFIYYSFLICYFIFFYYEHVVALGMVYRSDYINF